MDTELYQMIELRQDPITKNKECEQIIQHLNSLINNTEKWKQRLGICVLLAVLKKCDAEVFEEHATAWMRFILKIINTIPSEDLLRICFRALRKVLEYGSGIDKVSRDLATRGMDTLLTLLITSSSVPLSPHKLEMLKICIRRFPGPCGQHRTNLIKLTVRAIESDDCLICASGCELYTLIAMCGTAGEKKNRLAENWVNQFYQVTNTIFYYLSKLHKTSAFSDDLLSSNVDTTKLIPFSEVIERIDISNVKISSRMERLLQMLQNMISAPMEFEVHFPLLRLVKVFCELCNKLHVDLKENEGFALMRTKMSTAFLKCISASIRQLKTSLIVFSQQFGKMLSSVVLLRDTINRHLLYQCFLDMLNHWTILPSNTLDLLLTTIFSDVEISEKSSDASSDADVLTKKDSLTNNLKNDISGQSRKEIKRLDYTVSRTVYAALVLLEKILVLNGSLLSADNLNSILSNISNACASIYRKDGCVASYALVETRMMLLRVARRFLHLHHGLVQIPAAIILSHFTDGLTDAHIRIRNYCREVIVEYDAVLHALNLGFYGNKTDCLQHEFVSTVMGETTTFPRVTLETGLVCSNSNAELGSQGIGVSGERVIHSSASADNILSQEAKTGCSPHRHSAEPASSNTISSPGKAMSIPHPNRNLSQSFTTGNRAARPCGSADQVLARNAEPIQIPKRSTSEPQVFHSDLTSNATNPHTTKSPNKIVSKLPATVNSLNTTISKTSANMTIGNAPTGNIVGKPSDALIPNKSKVSKPPLNAMTTISSNKLPPLHPSTKSSNIAIHIDDESPSPDKDCVTVGEGYNDDHIDYSENNENYNDNYDGEDCYGNQAVVVSDSSDDDVAITKSVQKISAVTPGNHGNIGGDENMYSPRAAKRAKMNSNDRGASLQYNEDDADYILSTFCENTNAD